MTYKGACKNAYGHNRRVRALLFATLLFLCALIAPMAARAQQDAPAEEAPFDYQPELLVLSEQGIQPGFEASIRILCQTLTYMNRSFYRARPQQDISFDGYSAIIVLIPPSQSLSDELAQRLRETSIPVLLLGQGGMEQLLQGTESVGGNFTASYSFFGNQPVRLTVGEKDLLLPTSWDKAVGGEIGTQSGEKRPWVFANGNITTLCWFDGTHSSMSAILSRVLADWLWPFKDAPPAYASYLVLDQVYPFEDIDKLLPITQMMIELNAPYAINVMPIYDNAHYPAMKLFCEYLRYAQSQGAAIVMRVPLARLAQIEPEEIQERIALAYEGYAQYGVYPLALVAPESYLFTQEGLDILRSTRTVMLFETEDQYDLGDRNLAYSDGHYVIAPAYTAGSSLYVNTYSSAVYLDIDSGLDDLRTQVEGYLNSPVPLRSAWSLSNSLYLGNHVFSNEAQGGVFFDNRPVILTYEPFEFEENFDFNRGFLKYMTEQIEASNQLILTLVFVSCTIFLVLIFLARRQMRRQFLRRQSQEEAERRGVDM